MSDGPDPELARYSRQTLFAPLGEAGQRALRRGYAVIVGCGALGSVLASTLARAGVGKLRIVDRDFIELDNLQRQILFDEHDIAANLPKAEAAARKLRRINSAIEIEPMVSDVNAGNAERICGDADIILDGTDNFETRFLLNDLAVKNRQPWVYGACIGAEGLVMPIFPGEGPCLRCIWEEAPPPGTSPTCDTAGVLGPVVSVVASLQALEALKILAGRLEAVNRNLVTLDLWSGSIRNLNMQSAREQGDCPCCKQGRYEYLSGEKASAASALCGRNAVQVLPASGSRVNLKQVSERLRSGRPALNEFMLRFQVEQFAVTLFADGRAIVKGTNDPVVARSVYAKYVGA